MAFLARDGAKINYETWLPQPNANGDSEGGWVLLVNGHTRSLTDFRLFAKYLTGIGKRVVAFDNRGAGKTECAPDFSIDDIVDDAIAILDELRADEADTLGISFGGAISMTLAHRHAARVRRLALVSTGPRFPHARTGRRPEMARYFSPHFAETNPLLFKTLTKETDRAGAAAGTAAQARAIADFEAAAWLGTLSAPTLVVHGEDDAILPPALAIELSETIPDAKLVLVPRAGHLLLAEAPRKLYEAVGAHFA